MNMIHTAVVFLAGLDAPLSLFFALFHYFSLLLSPSLSFSLFLSLFHSFSLFLSLSHFLTLCKSFSLSRLPFPLPQAYLPSVSLSRWTAKL